MDQGCGRLHVVEVVVADQEVFCEGDLGGAKALYRLTKFNAGGFLPGFDVTPKTLAIGAVIAVVLMLASGLAPAMRAARLPVVTALRNVG